MPYSIELKEKAISLRKQGYSLKEIAALFKIAKSTASLWLSDIELDDTAQSRLKERRILGQYKAIQTKKLQKQEAFQKLYQKTSQELSSIEFNQKLYKSMIALLYWAEGGKSKLDTFRFTNSDPKMISTVLRMLRKAFNLDESKFRALVHLHEYHNENEIKAFWSHVTQIPLNQFNKSYQKPHTSKRKKEGYKGTLALYYFDVKIARELHTIYNILATT